MDFPSLSASMVSNIFPRSLRVKRFIKPCLLFFLTYCVTTHGIDSPHVGILIITLPGLQEVYSRFDADTSAYFISSCGEQNIWYSATSLKIQIPNSFLGSRATGTCQELKCLAFTSTSLVSPLRHLHLYCSIGHHSHCRVDRWNVRHTGICAKGYTICLSKVGLCHLHHLFLYIPRQL
jgi:hypothetical protein